MARKAIVDRNTVLKLLQEGKTSGSIALQFGVSRQAIDLHRKEFLRTGVLEARVPYHAAPIIDQKLPPPLTDAPKPVKNTAASLDQVIDLLIQSFSAMKKLPELEAEVKKLQQQYTGAMIQVTQLEEREKKRLEQEIRWREVQQPSSINQ
mgnify:FL=1